MLRYKTCIRLTGPEFERLTSLTGMVPVQVKSLEDLDNYFRRCKAYYWGTSRDTRFLRHLIDCEYSRLLGAAR